MNVGPDHLTIIENGEEPTNIKEGLPDVQLFTIRVANGHFIDIISFFSASVAPAEYTLQQTKELVVQAMNFSLITGQLYKMVPDEILCRYIPEYEIHSILAEAHGGVMGGHYAGKSTV